MMIELNEDQKHTSKLALKWWITLYKQVFVIQGGPGVGKTTMIFTLIELFKLRMDEVLFCTYVGRATIAMRLNGVNGKTIHSTCYEKMDKYVLDKHGNPIKLPNGRYKKETGFELKESLPSGVKLIVVDEGGMVNDKMSTDLESFGIPILVTGDRDQLDPVFGKSRWMQNPDVILTQIMRQKAGDPIIHLSKLARENKPIPLGQYGSKCFVVDEGILKHKEIFTKPDITICSRNVTRDSINNIVRHDIRKFNTPLPQLGDKLVCRKNNWDESVGPDGQISLINGLFGYVQHIYDESYIGRSVSIDFRPECVKEWFEDIPIDLDYLAMNYRDRKEYNQKYAKGNIMEYGYAGTCHMCQGSQYGYVLGIDDHIGDKESYRKFMYTMITRAVHTLVIVKKSEKKYYFNYD